MHTQFAVAERKADNNIAMVKQQTKLEEKVCKCFCAYQIRCRSHKIKLIKKPLRQ